MLVDAFEDEFQSRLLRAAARATCENGLDFVAVGGGVLGLEQSNPKTFIYDLISAQSVDALLIASHVIGHHSTLTEVQDFVDRYTPLPRISLGVELEGIPSLLTDNEAGMHTMVNHLLTAHGHRNIAFVTGPKASQEADARYQGYSRALREAGIAEDPRLLVHGDFLRESGERAVHTLFEARGLQKTEVDAIVCADDAMALGALTALLARGLRVPRDIALTGFDDIEFGRYAPAPLTTVRQPIVQQVRHGVRLLASALNGEAPEPVSVTFQSEFVQRRSCGCTVRECDSTPSWSAVDERRDFALALRSRWDDVTRDLQIAAHGALELVTQAWETRLLNGLLSQLSGETPEAFFEAVEDILNALLQQRGEVGACQDVLVALRRHAMRCASTPDDRARLGDLLQEALLMASDTSAISQAQRRAEALATRRVLGDATTALLVAPDLATLSEIAANHLPQLGIKSAVIALFTEPNRLTEELDAVLVFNERGRTSLSGQFESRALAPAGFLDGRSVIAEPLGFRGERLGIGLFEYGSYDSILVGELRQAISSSVKGALLARALEEAKRKVEALAVTDPLTGLYNRRHLSVRLREEYARANRHQRPLSVIMVDLDGFKQINDEYGHDEGDKVLKRVAGILGGKVRAVDTVARFGGDEFVIVLSEASKEIAEKVGQRILDKMEGDLDAHGVVSASLGIATNTFGDNPTTDEEQLIRQADHAMFSAKRSGKNRVCHFDDCATQSLTPKRFTRSRE
ncbi:substrate-binding and GGDEF domain-containing protein [Enhygromyxa salina]|uniref:diguanylate cyclase n=1 Tax=Enhygromyxa salina TaxID=215803 RepID=A0A2S9Y0D7_9BACT|nr:GGDEF domain-containing protein [Enhygromyxa salina]PRP98588.1 Diguanylate cyclase DosC [Enhygromyxa salina]